MINDTVEKIKDAEMQAEKRKQQVSEKSVDIIAKAKQDKDKLISDILGEAKISKEQIIKTACEKKDKILRESDDKINVQIESLKKDSLLKQEQAINFVVENII